MQNEERRNRLQREWLEFPKEDDLKTAAKALAECEYKLEISVRQLGEQQIITEKERKNLDQIRIKVRELCSKAYLTPRLELFVQTLDGLRNYKELLASLQVL